MTFTVPTVDITPYVADGRSADKAEVARQIDEACRTVGFMQIVGHGIPADIIDGLMDAMDAFFALDLDVKKQYRTPPQINRGYSPPKSESLSLSLGVESANRMNDFFEAFNVGATAAAYPGIDLPQPDYADNVWPAVDGFETQVSAYFAEAGRVARTMTRIFADALGLEPDFFAARTGHSLDVMRMNNYALPPGTDVTLDGDLVGMGEHTDFGIVTVLWADQVKGLQVLSFLARETLSTATARTVSTASSIAIAVFLFTGMFSLLMTAQPGAEAIDDQDLFGFTLIVGFPTLVATTGAVVIVFMAGQQREREIQLAELAGATPAQQLRQALFEAVIVVVTGVIVGLVCALLPGLLLQPALQASYGAGDYVVAWAPFGIAVSVLLVLNVIATVVPTVIAQAARDRIALTA